MEPEIIIKPYNEWVFTASAVIFAVAMLWESYAPRRTLGQSVMWRWGNNFSIGLLNWWVSALAATWLSLALATWANNNGVGLMSRWDAPIAVGVLLLLLLSQFLSYWIHRAFHQLKWLWPIHAVHHSDPDVDVSTSYRHHPLEPLLSLGITSPIILLLGASPDSVFYFRLFAVAATVFSHSNVGITPALERHLRRFILTPDYHRVHHCADRQYTNSNYGSLVPWFDYMFGTARFRAAEDQKTMELGLEYFREPKDNRVDRQILQPLRLWRSQPGRAEEKRVDETKHPRV